VGLAGEASAASHRQLETGLLIRRDLMSASQPLFKISLNIYVSESTKISHGSE